jgi:lipoyl(octanoyl) transferase
MRLEVLDLGLIDYDAAWSLQDEFAAEIGAGKRGPTLLLLEHPHIYTFGKAGNASNLLLDATQLKQRDISVRWVDRGGDVTYHGPGQLVGYPLLPLGRLVEAAPDPEDSREPGIRIPRADYVGYVRTLERALITTLAHLGIAAAQIPRLTGVWVQPDVYSRCSRCRPEDRQKPAKIAAIGVKVDSRGVSRHGFALNVDPDMAYWDGIIPCGLTDYPIASVADLVPEPPPMSEIKRVVARSLADDLGYELHFQSSSVKAS